MFDLIQNVLLVFIEIMCCRIFYESFGEVRHKGWVNAVQLFLMLGAICLIVYGLSQYFVVKQICAILIFSAFMLWHVKISLKKSLVLAVLFDALLLAMDYPVYLVMEWLLPGSRLSEQQMEAGGALAYLLVKLALFLLVLAIRRRFGRRQMEIMTDAEWLKFLFFPVFTIAVISAMLSVYESVKTMEQAYLLSVIAFGMVGMNIMVYYLINDIAQRDMRIQEDRIFHIQAENQLEMYRSISEGFDRQKRKTHEYKNQIACIESLLGKKQYPQLEEYVRGIYGGLNKELDSINTNNVIINAILNTKYQEIDSEGIVFVFKINDLSGLKIKDEDAVTILSNLLDNAIEACRGCEGKKVIKLKFVMEDGQTIISVKNTFENPVIYENGEIKSSKKSDVKEHGIGIKNIIRAVEKYGGSYVIKEDGREFYFSIIIK